MKSLINASTEFSTSIRMLSELLTQEWESAEEQEKFSMEIVKSIVGDEKTIATKVCNIDGFLKSIDDNISHAREWKHDIDRQISVAENIKKRIKTYALDCLKIALSGTGKKEIENNGIKISYQSQGEKEPVEIIDEALIPFEYFTEKVTVTKVVDKDKIRDAIKKTGSVAGARILPQSEGIRIKTILPKE